MKRRWLILSHGFNMDGRAASQTITDKIPYLLSAGLELQILSAVTGIRDKQISHRQLMPWGPSGFRFDFRHWLRLRIGKGVGYKLLVGLVSLLLAPLILAERLVLGFSSQWSWALPAALIGIWRVKTEKVDLVYSTGGAWSAHLAGWWIKKMTGVTWIAEIHDPMIPPGREVANLSRDERARAWLEGKLCQDADHVWWFTEGALASAARRHPNLGKHGFSVLAGAEPPKAQGEHQYGEKLRIGHFGSIAPGRSLKPFLEALAVVLDSIPELRSKIEVHVYGVALDKESEASIKKLQCSDLVICHGRVERDPVSGLSGREQIMKLMRSCDVLLLLHGEGPECAEYIPSKFYEYLWARRPVFALTHLNPQFNALLYGHAAYQADSRDPAAIQVALSKMYEDWHNQKLPEDPLPAISVKAAVDAILVQVEGRQRERT